MQSDKRVICSDFKRGFLDMVGSEYNEAVKSCGEEACLKWVLISAHRQAVKVVVKYKRARVKSSIKAEIEVYNNHLIHLLFLFQHLDF